MYCANALPDARSFVICMDLGPAQRKREAKQSGLLLMPHGTEVKEGPAALSV